jgi:signal transduction histidine kinase
VEIGPQPRDLQIVYTSPTLSIPQRVSFRYKLEGLDEAWHEAGSRRQAFYSDLPPGSYTFRVMAANADGVWTEQAAVLDLSVAPAYYETTWFLAGVAMVFLALVWTAHQVRTRLLLRRFALTLDARVNERTRIARELHDTLLQSFHGVLLRLQTASYLWAQQPEAAKQTLDSTIAQAANAITEGRDAVQALRTSTVEGNDLARVIRTLGDELALQAAPHGPSEFHVLVEGEPREMHPIARDEIYKIAAEALRNAFRHARANRVEAEIRYDRDEFRLRVRDDGDGIDAKVLAQEGRDGHYGLRGMPERAAIIGGKLAVWSEVGAGTEIELRLPAAKLYTTAARHPWWSRLAGLKRASSGGDRVP